MIIRAAHVEGPLPESPDDPRWHQAEPADVRLRNVVNIGGEMTAPQTVSAVSFRTVYNQEAISFRLSWHDPSEDRTDAGDAAALVLRPTHVRGDTVTLQIWPLRDSSPLDLCLWSAARQQAHEAIINSYDPLLEGRAQHAALLASRATYHYGAWTLVLTRPRIPSTPEAGAQIVPRHFIPIAFAVWDGGNPGQRAVSPWIDVILQEPLLESTTPTRDIVLVWVVSVLVLLMALGLIFKKP